MFNLAIFTHFNNLYITFFIVKNTNEMYKKWMRVTVEIYIAVTNNLLIRPKRL